MAKGYPEDNDGAEEEKPGAAIALREHVDEPSQGMQVVHGIPQPDGGRPRRTPRAYPAMVITRSSAWGSAGLVRWWSNPACWDRRLSSSLP